MVPRTTRSIWIFRETRPISAHTSSPLETIVIDTIFVFHDMKYMLDVHLLQCFTSEGPSCTFGLLQQWL